MKKLTVTCVFILIHMIICSSFFPIFARSGNKPHRMEWLKDAGLGLFIHWSLDSQIGTVISHSLVGASDDYVDRFFKELPRTFNPNHGMWYLLPNIIPGSVCSIQKRVILTS